MRRTLAYCLVCLALVCTLSCKKGPVIIPKGDMAKIYAEMFMADEAIGSQSLMRRIADTSRVYAPIFAKYGYSVDDFHASEEKYINDAGRYARIIKKAVRMLEAENKVLIKERDRLDAIRRRAQEQLRFRPHRIFLLDTLKMESLEDSLFRFDFQLGLDTVFAGPRIIVKGDTLVRDTVQVALQKESPAGMVEDAKEAAQVEDKGPAVRKHEVLKKAVHASF